MTTSQKLEYVEQIVSDLEYKLSYWVAERDKLRDQVRLELEQQEDERPTVPDDLGYWGPEGSPW